MFNNMSINKTVSKLCSALLAIGVAGGISGCESESKQEVDTSGINALLQPVEHEFSGKVIIIGAGAAGLAAANQLERNNVDYQILEATNHYGGRIQKNEGFADFPIDIGAEWIHADKNSLNHLLGIEGDEPAQEVIKYAPLDVYYLSSASGLTKAAESDLRNAYENNPEYKFKHTTWFDYIENNLAELVESKIVYNSPVISVDYSGSKVQLKTLGGAIYSADKVISTVSISVLKRGGISFIPAFSSQKISAIESVEFYPGFKLFMKFSEDFYADVIEVETEIGEKTFYDVAYAKDASDHVFGLLSTGTSAQQYYLLGTKEKIVDKVLQELDTIYDGAASEYYLDDYLFKDWGRHEYTMGTWTADYDENLVDSINSSLNKKVYFAGETHDINGAVSTVHGAILSGYSVVNQLLSEVDL